MEIKGFLHEKVLSINDRYILCFSRGCLIIRNAVDGKFIQKLRIQPAFRSFSLIERMFRYGPRASLAVDTNLFIYSDHGSIFEYDVIANKVSMVHRFNRGMNNPLSFCARYDVDGNIVDVLYGEYIQNAGRGPVSVYRKYGHRWRRVYTFQSDAITHIHNLVYDKYRDRYIILTGDEDRDSGIWEADSEFKNVRPIVLGKQMYRSCVLYPAAEGLYYATDTPLEQNWVYKLSEKGGRVNLEKICGIPGPCIFGKAENGEIYLATSVEGDPSLSKWRYRLSSKPGPGVKDRYVHIIKIDLHGKEQEICKFEKDVYPMGLFQFGNAVFADNSSKNNDKIYVCPQSVKSNFKTYVISK